MKSTFLKTVAFLGVLAVLSAASALQYDELMRLKKRAGENPDRPIALQLVVYDYMLREEMKPVFDAVDIVQYWTWCGKDLASLPERFRLSSVGTRQTDLSRSLHVGLWWS